MVTQVKHRDKQRHAATAGPTLLQALFPEAPGPVTSPGNGPASRRLAAVAVHVTVLAAGAAVMLARIPGRPAWTTIYNEDLVVYLEDALARPWQLFITDGGYGQLMPRLVGQIAAHLPLHLAAAVFALTGAFTSAACAVLVFHASAGHIRSVTLRILAGASVLLLPIATLEIADSTLGTPWFLLLALFWAALWRPPTRTGMAAAAAVAFFASSAQPMTLLLAPLFAARLAVLRRLRDHVVTMGWAIGLLVQIPVVLASEAAHHSRVNAPVPVGQALAFYLRSVVQSALGWHIGWWLQSAAGAGGAIAIVGVILAAFFTWVLFISPLPSRLLIAVALVTGFVFTFVISDLGYRFAVIEPITNVHVEHGSRYATLGVFLIDCAVIVAVDAFVQRCRANCPRNRDVVYGLRRGHGWQQRLTPGLALVAVLAVLSAGWVTDYRFATPRVHGQPWAEVLARWERDCAGNRAGTFQVETWDDLTNREVIPCARLPLTATGSTAGRRLALRDNRPDLRVRLGAQGD